MGQSRFIITHETRDERQETGGACLSSPSLLPVASHIPAQVAFRKRVEIAVEYRLDIAGLVLGAVIFDQCIGMQVVCPHLAAEVGLAMLALEPGALVALARQLTLEQ